MQKPPLFMGRDVIQNAWVVTDLEAAMRGWTDLCGVGPFFTFPHVELQGLKYHGRPASLDMTVAIAQAGPVQIELIQQHCDNPSCYTDAIPRGGHGFHHMGIFAKDYDRELARYREKGFPVAAEGVAGAMRFAYIDTRSVSDCMVELMEETPEMRAAFQMIADAAKDWDGSDPVRPAY